MMSLASRHAPAASGTGHPSIAPVSNVVVVPPAAAHMNVHGTTNHLTNTRTGSNNLMNLLNSGLSVPRQIVVLARSAQDNLHVHINLNFTGTIGQGTFGQIERATLTVPTDPNGEAKVADRSSILVAVKRVLQDPRYKNRELSIMQRLNNHPNVVKFYYYYYSTAPRVHKPSNGRNVSTHGVDVFLHLVLECFPESLCELIYRHLQRNIKLTPHMVRVFTYQMLKALAYLHSHQICHRDIKSSNLLVDESTLVLKVCDFGSAKEMVPGAANVSYISSRYYRAPELLFGAQAYTCAIDTWSAGCVLAEMLRQHCLFMGADSVDQLVKVIRVLGTPSSEDIASMNPLYVSYNFPDVQPCPVKLFFPQYTPPDLLALMSKMLVYNPALRISPSDALSEPCFNVLRELNGDKFSSGHSWLPPHLFEPNAEPRPPTTVAPEAPSNSETLNNSNCFPPTDSSHLHSAVSRKASDKSNVSDQQKVGNNKPSADWSKKGRPSGSTNLTKPNNVASDPPAIETTTSFPSVGNCSSSSNRDVSSKSRPHATNSSHQKKSGDKDDTLDNGAHSYGNRVESQLSNSSHRSSQPVTAGDVNSTAVPESTNPSSS